MLRSMDHFRTGGPPEILIFEEIGIDDSRSTSEEFIGAEKEITGLTRRKVFVVVSLLEIAKREKILDGRFVLVI